MGSVTLIKPRARRSGVAFEPPRPVDPTPEAVLGELFRQEAELEAQLRLVRAKLGLVRRLYADKHRLLVLPDIEQLRRTFGR